MNIAHALSSTRHAWRLAAAFALLALLSALAFAPPPLKISANSPPETPPSVTVSRADGTITASGYAVSNATKYHITYTTDNGGSWHAPVDNHTNWTSTSITFSADNAKTYIIGIRAGNDHGWSGWRNSPSSGPYQTSPTPTPTPAPQPPSAVTSVSLTRADGTVTANWKAVNRATKYHITYSADGGGSWHAPINNHTNWQFTSITFNADNSKTYIMGVRAGNASGWSGWINSPAAGPYTPPQPTPTPTPTPEPTPTPAPQPTAAAPTGLTATAGNGSVALAWNDPADSSITGYEYQVNHNDTATGNLSGWGAWTAIASSDADTTSHTITGLTNGKEYRYKLRAVNAGGSSKPAPQSAPWYVAATPEVPTPPPAAPSNLSVTPGNGYMDISWDAVSDATGYDLRAKASGSSSWHSVASNISGTSHRYTTSQTIDFVAVRSRNANGAGAWAELSRAPAHNWLTTVIQGGASGQSVQAQNQLAAPASITVTRDNLHRDEKLHVTWAAVSGAGGYNLACAAESGNTLRSGWSWWHCGSVDSGSTTTFTVDHDKRGGVTRDLGWNRSYSVAVRAVTSSPAQAGPWLVSDDAHPAYHPESITASRADGSVSISWTAPQHLLTYAEGYEIECATRTGNVSAAYTVCADVEDATPVNGKLSATISSWTAGGTDYTIDDTKTYDLQVRTTNAWGKSSWQYAPLIYPDYRLTISNIGVTTATLTIANRSGNWYYKANAAPDNSCKGPVSGSSKDLTGLSAHTSYDYSAYSDSTCATANELAAAAQFTTLSSVSNLGSTKSGDANIHSALAQAVAFTTGTASKHGYTLKSVTLPLKNKGGTQGLTVNLYEMEGTGAYTKDSVPKRDAVANATLSGTAPTSSSWTDTIYTCSGSGCELESGKTYFVTLGSTELTSAYATAYASTEAAETVLPADNGWSVGYGHYKVGTTDWTTFTTPDWNIAKFVFAHVPDPSLSASNVTATGATLTISDWNKDWYYKATSGPHTTCQGPVSGTSTILSGLTTGSTYTYTAYSDSACTTANELAAASPFSTDSSVSNLTSTKGSGSSKINSALLQAVAFTTGANTGGYVLKSVTVPLRYDGGSHGVLATRLYEMDGTGTYSSASQAVRDAVAKATFTGTTPTTNSFTDTTFTCSGSGCKLDANTTYFVVLASGANYPGYGWAYTTTENEVALPADNGWGIGFGHYRSSHLTTWLSDSDWSLAKFVFANVP